jgi:spermidine/putrescine transport system ATP-binding protein
LAEGTPVTLSVRPEQIELTRKSRPDGRSVQVINRIFLGEHTEYLVRDADLGDMLVLVARQAEAAEGAFAPGDMAFVGWAGDAALILERH